MDNNAFDHDQTVVRYAASASGWRRPLTIGAVVVALAGGLGLAAAQGEEFAGRFGWTERMGDAGGPGMMQKARWGGHHGGMHGGGFMHGAGALMEEIDATPEQEKKLYAIFDGVRAEMRDTMVDFRSTRGEILDILGAETVDRAALEKLRAERVAAIDAASKTMTDALAEAAAVLSPEQRSKLAEFVEENRGRRGWGRW